MLLYYYIFYMVLLHKYLKFLKQYLIKFHFCFIFEKKFAWPSDRPRDQKTWFFRNMLTKSLPQISLFLRIILKIVKEDCGRRSLPRRVWMSLNRRVGKSLYRRVRRSLYRRVRRSIYRRFWRSLWIWRVYVDELKVICIFFTRFYLTS